MRLLGNQRNETFSPENTDCRAAERLTFIWTSEMEKWDPWHCGQTGFKWLVEIYQGCYTVCSVAEFAYQPIIKWRMSSSCCSGLILPLQAPDNAGKCSTSSLGHQLPLKSGVWYSSVKWCRLNHLQLSVSLKSWWWTQSALREQECKYLGVHSDWTKNTDALDKKRSELPVFSQTGQQGEGSWC